MQPDGLYCSQLAFVIPDKFLDCGFINTGILTKLVNRFLLTIIHLTYPRPFGPWIGFGSFIRCLRHHFDLDDTLSSLTDSGSDTVISGITTTDNHNIFILGTDPVFRCLTDLHVGIQ